jgi:hypothetical protein
MMTARKVISHTDLKTNVDHDSKQKQTLTRSVLDIFHSRGMSFICRNMPLSATTMMAANTHWKI